MTATAVRVGPCRGPRFASQLGAAKAAISCYSTATFHRCPAGHYHPDRPSLAARIVRYLTRAAR